MDLSLIQTHLDNFVTTWEGWGKVLNHIAPALTNILGGIVAIGDSHGDTTIFAPGLSSLSSK